MRTSIAWRVLLSGILLIAGYSSLQAGTARVTTVQTSERAVVMAAKKSAPAKKTKRTTPAKKPATPAKPVDPTDLPMRVVIVQSNEGTQWISAEGRITDDTPALFRKVLKKAGKRKLPVLLSSWGGSVDAAMAIGRMIRKAGLDVSVGSTRFEACRPEEKSCILPKSQEGIYRGVPVLEFGFCVSACPLVLAGGVARYSPEFALIAVHQFHTYWTDEHLRYLETYRIVKGKKKVVSRKLIGRKTTSHETFGISKSMRKVLDTYLDGMGVSHDLIDEMAKAEYSSSNELSHQRVRDLLLINTDQVPMTFRCVYNPTTKQCTLPVRPPPIAQTYNEMVVSLQRGTKCEPICPEWISAEGVITADTPQRFRDVFSRIGSGRLPVVLNSKGGDLDAALEIGRMIREKGLITAVARSAPLGCAVRDKDCSQKRDPNLPYHGFLYRWAWCDRACLFILAGGVQRLVVWQVLPAYLPPLDSFTTRQKGATAASLITAHLDAMGVSPALLDRLDKSIEQGGLDLELLDLVAYRLATDRSEPDWTCQDPGAISNCVYRAQGVDGS